MSTRLDAPVARTLSRLHRWLRDSWLGRIDLAAWARGWHEWLFEETGSSRSKKPMMRFDLLALEQREVPNDIFGLLGTPFAFTGIALINGNLLTPVGVLARGWSGGHGLPVIDGSLAGLPIRTGESPAIDHAQDWITSHSGSIAAADNSGSGVSYAAPASATVSESSQRPTNEDPFANPMGDDWLNAVGISLEAAARQRRGLIPGDGSNTSTSAVVRESRAMPAGQ